MARVGRPRRELAPEMLQQMFRLFQEGLPVKGIAKACGCSDRLASRLLTANFGDLRVARRLQKAHKVRAAELGHVTTSFEYREGFEAGFRQALTLVNLHGLEGPRAYCNDTLLLWRHYGIYTPPIYS